MHRDAERIIEYSIKEVLPENGVISAMAGYDKKARFVAIGKAAWEMGKTCANCLGKNLIEGVVITKYGHSKGAIEKTRIFEAGHPIPDENGLRAAEYAINMALSLGSEDNLIFLISGGGSALFEIPQDGLTLADIMNVTRKLLECGASISEINAVRKRLSKVKGGKFASLCGGADIYAIILSDVLGSDPGDIASGPVTRDFTTYEDICGIINKYDIELSEKITRCLKTNFSCETAGARVKMTGSVSLLCQAAAKAAGGLGYKPYILTDSLSCEAAQAGSFIASMAGQAKKGGSFELPCALIFGGETVVKVTGSGKGGRNQEIALAAAKGIAGLDDVLIFSLGSDGTDGPTDAAGGIADGKTEKRLVENGILIDLALKNNDSYNALNSVDALIFTGPTGTNVNDITVALIK